MIGDGVGWELVDNRLGLDLVGRGGRASFRWDSEDFGDGKLSLLGALSISPSSSSSSSSSSTSPSLSLPDDRTMQSLSSDACRDSRRQTTIDAFALDIGTHGSETFASSSDQHVHADPWSRGTRPSPVSHNRECTGSRWMVSSTNRFLLLSNARVLER